MAKWCKVGWVLYLDRKYINEATFIRLYRSGDQVATLNYVKECREIAKRERARELADAMERMDAEHLEVLKKAIPVLLKGWFKKHEGNTFKVKHEIKTTLLTDIEKYKIEAYVNQEYAAARDRYRTTAKIDNRDATT